LIIVRYWRISSVYLRDVEFDILLRLSRTEQAVQNVIFPCCGSTEPFGSELRAELLAEVKPCPYRVGTPPEAGWLSAGELLMSIVMELRRLPAIGRVDRLAAWLFLHSL